MTAAGRREELEATIWRRVHNSAAKPTGLTRKDMDEILAAADRYRDAAVGELATRMTSGQLAALGRAEAEEHRRTA